MWKMLLLTHGCISCREPMQTYQVGTSQHQINDIKLYPRHKAQDSQPPTLEEEAGRQFFPTFCEEAYMVIPGTQTLTWTQGADNTSHLTLGHDFSPEKSCDSSMINKENKKYMFLPKKIPPDFKLYLDIQHYIALEKKFWLDNNQRMHRSLSQVPLSEVASALK